MQYSIKLEEGFVKEFHLTNDNPEIITTND